MPLNVKFKRPRPNVSRPPHRFHGHHNPIVRPPPVVTLHPPIPSTPSISHSPIIIPSPSSDSSLQSSGPSKIALLMGCEYVKYANQGKMDRLPGCFDDVSNMNDLLTKYCGYKHTEIITELDPTKDRIWARLNQLKQLAVEGKVSQVFVYYSGHGTRTAKRYLPQNLLFKKSFLDSVVMSEPLKIIKEDEKQENKERIEKSEPSENQKTTEPLELSETHQKVESSELSEPQKTIESSELSEPQKIIEPLEPSETHKTIEPSDLSETHQTIEPSDLSETHQTVESSELSEPQNIIESSGPSEPQKIIEPLEIHKTIEPLEPSEPSEIHKTTESSEPSQRPTHSLIESVLNLKTLPSDAFIEYIIPSDFLDKGLISDTEMYDSFVSQIPSGVRLRGMFDSCFSGTIWNLPNQYSVSEQKFISKTDTNTLNNTDIMTLSGSTENQESASALDLDKTNGRSNDWEGSMTYYFRQYLKQNNGTALLPVFLNVIRLNLKSGGFTQIPQIYSSSLNSPTQFI